MLALKDIDEERANAKRVGFFRRLAAFLIDLPLALMPTAAVTSAIGLALSTGDDYERTGPHVTQLEDFAIWPLVILVLGLLLSFFWIRGISPGAWLFRIRATKRGSGWRSAIARPVLRGLLTALAVVAGLLLFAGGFADQAASFNTLDYIALSTCGAVLACAVLGYLRLFLDSERRTFQDQLAGVGVIRRERTRR